MAIVDGITGKVYPPPLAVGKDHPSMLQRRRDPRFEGGYRLDSKLFAMETCNWDDIRYHDEGSTGYLPCTLFYFPTEPLGFKLKGQLTYDTPLPWPLTCFEAQRFDRKVKKRAGKIART